MNFIDSTGYSIDQAFRNYHKKNPAVYSKFKEFALSAINNGKKKISFKLIMNVIRWEVFMTTDDNVQVLIEGEPVKFKINDAYGSRYARMFVREFPQYEKYIQMRELRS